MCGAVGAAEVGNFRASSLTTLLEMVAGGLGVTLLPAMAREQVARTHRNIALIPFAAPAPGRTVGLVWRTTSTRGDEYRLLARSLMPRGPSARVRPAAGA